MSCVSPLSVANSIIVLSAITIPANNSSSESVSISTAHEFTVSRESSSCIGDDVPNTRLVIAAAKRLFLSGSSDPAPFLVTSREYVATLIPLI